MLLPAAVWQAAGYESPPPDEKKGASPTSPHSAEHRIVRISDPEARLPVETSVAINPIRPEHIVAVSQQARRTAASSTNHLYVSYDGGSTWKTTPAPNPDQRVHGDDVLAFGPDGMVHHAYIAFEGIRSPRPLRACTGIFTSSSLDGLQWNPAVPVVDHVNSVIPFEDKPWLAVDSSSDSPHRGNLYVAWTRFDVYGSKDPAHKSHIFFARSRDGGKSFAVPLRISEQPGDAVDSSGTVEGAMPAIGPKGDVYVAWAAPPGIVCCHSTDGGWSFTKEKAVANNPGGWDIPVRGLARHNGMPVIGIDRSSGKNRGSIYICWIDRRNNDPDVFVTTSRDGGATWSEPLRVNDDPKGNGKDQCFAWMAVDPADGSINIVFYDRRDQEGTLTELTLARSVDGGHTFVNHRLQQKPFACTDVFLGDYIGLDAFRGHVVAVYPHVLETKQIALSAALFHFKTGSQDTVPGSAGMK
jgi:hypothetical protein